MSQFTITPEQSPLGKTSRYQDHYDPKVLCAIARSEKRQQIGIDSAQLPFFGVDVWNAYELSWLNEKGKPQVAMARFSIAAHSPNLIESKSLKLYLNSLNQTKFASLNQVEKCIQSDLSACAGAEVDVVIFDLNQASTFISSELNSVCIDALDIEVSAYLPKPSLLRIGKERGQERLCSHLLKSNCLVTGQPDWGSLFIEYEGPKIDHASLLQYLISFRQHNEFHEQCIERIFMDLRHHCDCQRLTVSARYLRRGGLDINPLRTTESSFSAPIERLVRQ